MNRTPQTESILGRMVLSAENATPLPLSKTIIQGKLTGPLISVQVTQHFSNHLSQPVELDYLFPLPSKAAIVDFELHIGDRLIQADIQEMEQARQAYEEASRSGQRAGLLEQRRPNLFAIHLTNVLPGEAIQTSLRFQDRIKFEDGIFEVVFPMGLTPRYSTQDHTEEEEQTRAPVAEVGDEIGKVEVSLEIDAGVAVANVSSPTHPLHVDVQPGDSHMTVTLDGEHIPDHDFVLRYALVGETAQASAWTSHDQDGDTLLAALFPPALPEDFVPPQREFVFVLDRSGSMSGEPIAQARNALRACLRSLNPGDTFRILLFDDKLEWYGSKAAQMTQVEITRADKYIGAVEGRGGTEILQALQAVFDQKLEGERTRYIVFLTDGAVSAEERALQLIRARLGKSRLFTFGIGPSVNRALLEQMAVLGRGTSEFLQLDEDIEGAIIRFQDRVSFPVLTDLTLAWEGAKAWDIYPPQLPDLFAGQPLELCGRYTATRPIPKLVVHGRRAGAPVEMSLALLAPTIQDDTIQRVWNRARIDALLNRLQSEPGESSALRQEIISLALKARLVTPFTAFVAIDHDIAVKDTSQRQTIHVAQPLPKGLDRSGFMAPAAAGPSMARMMAVSKRLLPDSGSADLDLPAFLRRRSDSTPRGGPIHPLPPLAAGSVRDEAASFESDQGQVLVNEPPEVTLRWLARTQMVNGGWKNDVLMTSAALLAFVRHGHTTRTGDFRQVVKRAYAWLEKAETIGKAAFIRALALAELADATQQPLHQKAAAAASAALPAPGSLLEVAIQSCLDRKMPPTLKVNGEVDNLDDLRLCAIFKRPVKINASMATGANAEITRAWLAVLK